MLVRIRIAKYYCVVKCWSIKDAQDIPLFYNIVEVYFVSAVARFFNVNTYLVIG